MRPLDTVIARASANPVRIVLSEGEDPRIIEGAIRAVRDGIAKITLLGNTSNINAQLTAANANPSNFDIIDPLEAAAANDYADIYYELRKEKSVDRDLAKKTTAEPLAFAALMVRAGDAAGTIGGAVATTADTVRAALQIIGRGPGVKSVSSFFLMVLDEPHHERKGTFLFSDCGLIVEPSADDLTEIAIASATSYRGLIGEEPRIAMLSFSTHGSAMHKRATEVSIATAKVKELRPDLVIDGELQFDAAFVPEVSAIKTKNSPLKGEANILIFPNLEAANIGYKIAQRIGGAKAIGPVLQGLASPANDLSRGCNADDVYLMIAVTGAQAALARTEA